MVARLTPDQKKEKDEKKKGPKISSFVNFVINAV